MVLSFAGAASEFVHPTSTLILTTRSVVVTISLTSATVYEKEAKRYHNIILENFFCERKGYVSIVVRNPLVCEA